MNKFIRYWNQNRIKIIITGLIIAFVIIIIQAVNSYLKQPVDRPTSGNINNVSGSSKPTQSVITGINSSEEKTDENVSIINKFVEYCNSKEYEKAYSLLTDQCKNTIFSNDINKFIKNYCNEIFKTKKTYNLELWLSSVSTYTYKIKYIEDNLLQTGGAGLDKNYEDYITIINAKNGESKINISNFIYEVNMNKVNTVSGIEIAIKKREVYTSYEVYTIEIKNNTDKEIMINNGQNNKNICLLDDKNVTYSSFLNEVSPESLSLKAKYKKNMTIKFNKMYGVNRNIKKIQFKQVVLDKEAYIKNTEDTNLQKVDINIDI